MPTGVDIELTVSICVATLVSLVKFVLLEDCQRVWQVEWRLLHLVDEDTLILSILGAVMR